MVEKGRDRVTGKPRDKENKGSSSVQVTAGAVQHWRGQSRAVAVEASVPFLDVPRDEEDWRFTQSFAWQDEEAQARASMEEYGFVVFRDVLSRQETQRSRHEICDYVGSKSEGFDPADESTWDAWRGGSFGMPPSDTAAYWTPQLAANRRHRHVVAGFAQLLSCPPETMRCSHDRWALYPCSLRTRRNLHLDINPFLYTGGAEVVAQARAAYPYAEASELYGGKENLISAEHGPHLQGTIAMLDNEAHDAGFICVPGSHRHFDRWAAALVAPAPGKEGGPRYDFPDHSHYSTLGQRVPVREGSLIVWDVRLAHGSQPNLSAQGYAVRARIVQFVHLRTARQLGEEQAARRAALVRRLYAQHGLDEPVDPIERAVAGLLPGGEKP